MSTLLEGVAPAAAPAAAAAPVTAPAAAPAAQPAAAPAATTAPAFSADEARKFLTDHGVEAKSLEGLDEKALQDKHAFAKSVADKASAGAKPKAPDAYTFKAPEGVTLDAEFTKEFEAYARGAGLPQEQAQKGIELAAKFQQHQAAAQEKAHKDSVEGWKAASQTDKEFGGVKLDENLASARKAYDAFASPALRELFVKTGLRNHPEVIRSWFRIGQAIAEDKVVTTGRVAGDTGDIAQRLYGATSPKAG